MASVTLIGPDGAGKTTITQRLVSSGVHPFKYLYMGVNVSSSNTALFTSRIAERLKQRNRRHDAAPGQGAGATGRPRRGGRLRRSIRAAGRLSNRIADAWYRQVISLYHQHRGRVVLYDRHFVLDFAPEITSGSPDTLERRLHRWCLERICSSPDLVIFLDAPGEVLYARKGELTVEELDRRRQGFLRMGQRLPNFVRVDATRPLDVVYEEVVGHIVSFHGWTRGRPRLPAT